MRSVPLIAAVVAVIILTLFADHWRRQAAEERKRADAAVHQTRADAATAAASDRAARDVRIILQTGDTETRHVQTLPGHETPIDPARRALLCAALGRVFDDEAVCASSDPDRQPAGAVRYAAP